MTMKPRHALLLAVLLALAGPVSGATAREVSASELRQIVSAGGMLSLKAVVASVASSTGAEPIEARAFELDDIYYRVVLKRALEFGDLGNDGRGPGCSIVTKRLDD